MIYEYKGYELVITYNSMYEQHEGECKELGIYISSKSKDGLEYSFRERVDDLVRGELIMKELTYEEVYKEWGNSRYKSVFYKDKQLFIILVPKEVVTLPFPYKSPYRKAFYVGTFKYTPLGEFWSKRTSFESIHYDKVVSRFQRFVDEYCTDWVVKALLQYKGYEIKISREVGCKDFYIGYVKFHKNSTYKHIADTREEVERCCKNRIDKVVYEKEKVKNFTKPEFADTHSYKGYELEITWEPTIKYPYMGAEPYVGRVSGLRLGWRGKTPEDVKKEFREYFDEKGMGRVDKVKSVLANGARKHKIQELEQLQARISAQLEELKKEKDTLTYKGIVLEYGKEEWTQEGYLIGRIKDAPEGVDYFYGTSAETIKDKFEEYINDLEKSANIYHQLRKKYIR